MEKKEILKIKVKRHGHDFTLSANPKVGDWIDLKAAEDIVIKGPTVSLWPFWRPKVKFHTGKISLGVSMELPKGYEAIIACRSSTPDKFGVMIPNSIGVIDNTYQGDNDVWRFSFIGIKDGVIKKGDRICQFRIQPSQFNATDIRVEYVEELGNDDRGGFGSTGH